MKIRSLHAIACVLPAIALCACVKKNPPLPSPPGATAPRISPVAMIVASPRPAPSSLIATKVPFASSGIPSAGIFQKKDLTTLISSPSPKKPSAAPSARVPSQGPFALTALSVALPAYPEDFTLGPLEPDPSANPFPAPSLSAGGDTAPNGASAAAYAFLKAILAKKGYEAYYAPGRKAALSQTLRSYIKGSAKISSFRLGRLKRAGEAAEGRVFLFGEKGERTLAELYLARSADGWKVDGLTADFSGLDSGERAKAQRFAPQEYRLFSY